MLLSQIEGVNRVLFLLLDQRDPTESLGLALRYRC